MNTSTSLYTADQIKQRLNRAHQLLESSLFDPTSLDTGSWKVAFAELIMVSDELLNQSQQLGHRIDFYEGVGVSGKIQDITSLVEWMRACLPVSIADLAGQLTTQRLNRYFNQGTGYFANGSFFTGEFDNELALFIDDQRIYLKRQLGRAIQEAEPYLLHLN
ncbi:hypothetical protein EXU85_12770 [Spirosoma sp. KCTC 42546]|uniref:hypothetical protein n=1 Tax=Spirosoma sp. KCTC 42546 TaxID=2520506 RepID=UPI00115A6339|nr:hypothetical protein [Spirosoma sp. KCTC 42546]QDK79428.1 hypothetical protein EXU85_12770 [Spirosoma sp. KCTC 42546]